MTELLETGKLFASYFKTPAQNFFSSEQFWEIHGNVLTIDWFVVAFFAILIKRKYRGGFSLFLHTLLFILCNVTTLFVNFGAAYRLWPQINTFSTWSFLQQAHAITGAVFSVMLIVNWLGGIRSLVGGNSYYHKLFGTPVAYLGMLTAILGMLIAKEETKAAIFGVLFLAEAIILRRAKPQSYQSKSKINKSVEELRKPLKRD